MYFQETELTPNEAMELFNGYTVINGKIYVMSPVINGGIRFKDCIIFGYEYGRNGEILGLDFFQRDELVKNACPMEYQPYCIAQGCDGGYKNKNKETIIEKSCLVAFNNIPDVLLGAIAQKIGLEFRQESVIVVDSLFNAYFLEV